MLAATVRVLAAQITLRCAGVRVVPLHAAVVT